MSAIFKANTVTAAQISDATATGRALMTIPTAAGNSFIKIDAGNAVTALDIQASATLLANGNTPFAGTVSPVGSIQVDNGIMIAASS